MIPATTQLEKSQSTYQPVRKVTAGAFTGALVTLTVLILNTYHPFFKQENNQISGQISGAATTVLTFIVSYLVSPGREEAIATEDDVTRSAKK
jgi:Na+/proline symporter